MPLEIQWWNDKVLWVNNKLALDPACCCNQGGECFYVVGSAINNSSDPVYTPPIPNTGRLLWHAAKRDNHPDNTVPGENYHNHVWLIQNNVGGANIAAYEAELQAHAQANLEGLGNWADDANAFHAGQCSDNTEGSYNDLLDYLRDSISTPVSEPIPVGLGIADEYRDLYGPLSP